MHIDSEKRNGKTGLSHGFALAEVIACEDFFKLVVGLECEV